MAYLADIAEVSHLVEDPIRQMGLNAGEPELYADIFKACVSKEAFLFVEDTSFTVIRPEVVRGIKQMFVWVAYSKSGNAYAKFMPYIEERAKEVGCEQLTFWTALEPINRYIQRHGWKKKYTVWSKDV